jgi:hypothetical protein
MHKLVLALTAFAAVGASAQTVYSGQADQDRRERNREEALAAQRGNTTSMTTAERKEAAREKTHEVAQSTRRGAHKVAESTRRVTHRSASAVRRAGHKPAVKARDVTDRANAKFGAAPNKGKANPEGINPVSTSSASPTAPSNGVTK